MDQWNTPPGSRAVAIPMSGSMGGSSVGGSPRSGSSGPRAIASPFSQRATYADDDDDEPAIDPEDLWAPMGTPIPPATTGWWGKKTAVREYAPRRARSAAGSPATPATALPNARARPSRPRQPHFQAYWQQPQLGEGIASGQVFQAMLRVNGADRSQAFVSIGGLTSDVLVKGAAQNRAVDGDEVALRVLPPSQWHHMRGGALPSGDLLAVPASDPPLRSLRSPSHSGTLGRRDSDSSGGMMRRGSHTTPVAAIQEGILDNGAIEEGKEEDLDLKILACAEEGEEEGSSSSCSPASSVAAPAGDVDEDDDEGPGFRMDAEALSSAAVLAAGRPLPPPAPRSEGGAASPARLCAPELPARFSEALELSRPLAAGGLSQALHSPPAPGAPLSASWEGSSSGWGGSGGRWAGLTAQRGGRVPVADPPLTPGRRFATRSASAIVMRAPSSATSTRSISSLASLEEDEPVEQEQTPAAAIQAMNRLLEADPYLRATGQVVAITRPSRRRGAVVGVLKEEGTAGGGGGLLFLQPRDARLPRAVVQPSMLPAGKRGGLMQEAAQADGAAGRTLVQARIEEWDERHPFPAARVEGIIGPTGDLACETQALLAAESAPVSSDFPDKVLADLPALGWAVSAADLAGRRDLRADRVFSIDPPTARDLDDALSVERLPGGDLRVGVHIADVSHFVRPGSALDAEAALRGTSVYLMDRVIPMLPRRLCEELCSLQPGGARLTFSFIWELSPGGEIRSQWAGRTVIASASKLAYGHAQAVIDGAPPPEAPTQLHGGHSWEQVADDIRALHGLAQRRRAARQAAGALRLDNTKLDFQLDAAGRPVGCTPHEQREANQLVEEFMLLANISAATAVASAFPDRALLRRHPQPNPRKLAAAASAAKEAGLEFDTTSAGALAASLRALKGDSSNAATAEILQLLFTKPMQLAQYFCTGGVDEAQWGHYALAVPRYTHFTSPIRRYPDIVVHRLLEAALQQNCQHAAPQQSAPQQPAQQGPAAQQLERPAAEQAAAEAAPRNRRERRAPLQQQWQVQQQQQPGAPESANPPPELPSPKEVSDIAQHCNDTKNSAKAVQDAAAKLYLGALLAAQPAVAEGIVTSANVGAWFDVYVPRYGHEARLQTADMPCSSTWKASTKTLTLEAPRDAQRRSLPAVSPSGAGSAASAAAAAALAGLRHRSSADAGRGASTAGSPAMVGGRAAAAGANASAAPSNPASLTPLALPAQLRVFSRVPVVLSAGSGGAANRPFDITARLLLPAE